MRLTQMALRTCGKILLVHWRAPLATPKVELPQEAAVFTDPLMGHRITEVPEPDQEGLCWPFGDRGLDTP